MILPSGSKGIKKGLSCHRCYSRKIKCDRKLPSCSSCQYANVVCKSAVNTRNTPALKKVNRVVREESRLKRRIELYEKYMKRIGIDPRLAFSQESDDGSLSPTSFTIPDNTSQTQLRGSELQQIFFLLRGDCERANCISYENRFYNSGGNVEQIEETTLEQVKSYNQAFNYNTSEWFQNDSNQVLYNPQLHPDSFRMFKLFSIYVEHVHHFRPIMKRERLQEIFYTYGSIAQDPGKVTTIDPVYNALFFSIYCASIAFTTEETFLEIFPGETNGRLQLFESFYSATRYWLIKADFLQSNDLLVFESFIILFRAIQSNVQPRSFISIISMVRRAIERIGMEQFHSTHSPSHSESYSVQLKRWLILSLEIAEIESATFSRAAWTGPYPINVSDLQSNLSTIRSMSAPRLQHSFQDYALLNSIRYEVSVFRNKIRACHGKSVDWTDFSSSTIPLSLKLDEIDFFYNHLIKEYLQESSRDVHPCSSIRATSMLFLSVEVMEMKISAYACEERAMILRKEEGTQYIKIRQELLRLCIEAILTIQKAYREPNLIITVARNVINKPVLAIIHLLRICSAQRFRTYDSLEEDELAMKAWKCLDEYYMARRDLTTNLANVSTLHDLALLASWSSWSKHYQEQNLKHRSNTSIQFYQQNLVELDVVTDARQREAKKKNSLLDNNSNSHLGNDSENNVDMIKMIFNLSEPFEFDWNRFEQSQSL